MTTSLRTIGRLTEKEGQLVLVNADEDCALGNISIYKSFDLSPTCEE